MPSPSAFTTTNFPPFPASLTEYPTANLQTISLGKLLARNLDEQTRVFEACKSQGFFYLDLSDCETGKGMLRDVAEVGGVAEEIFGLPMEEKMRYRMAGRDLFGYKASGATVVDKARTPDTAEFFNLSKNDMILPAGTPTSRPWPAPVTQNKALLDRYCRTAHAIGLLIIEDVGAKLGIDVHEIRSRHVLTEPAGDHIRMTRGPPRASEEMPEIQTPSHTDFGTITLLANWLGGLQIHSESSRTAGPLEPSTNAGQWLWVRPVPNTLIVNLGDAAVKFSHGALSSGRHRVIPPPGAQGLHPRFSIVYFVRPNDACVLERLEGEGVPRLGVGEVEERVRAREWIFRQAEALRGLNAATA